MSQLSAEERKMVEDFATQIDITDSNTIMTYGAATQQKMADFSNKALDNVRTKDMGEVGVLLTGVVAELKGFNEEEEKGIMGFFKKQTNKVAMMKTKYDKAEVNVNRIVDMLQQHETRLMKDSAMLDKMYDMNLQYFKELTMYILAGKKRLAEAENVILPQLQEKARQSGLPEDAQAARKKEVKDKYQSRHGFGAEPESKERLKEDKTFAEDSQIWMKLKMRMPDGIGSAIQLILDEKGITQMELAMRMGVSRTAWRKWCAEKMSLRHIVAICIALDVRADIGMELVRLAGHSFLNNKENNILLAMMYETKDLTVARANEILRQEKLAPLTEGKDEEIAC